MGPEAQNHRVGRMLFGQQVALDFWQEALADHRLGDLGLGREKVIWKVDFEMIGCLQMTGLEGRSHRNRMGSNHLHHRHRRSRHRLRHPNRFDHREHV